MANYSKEQRDMGVDLYIIRTLRCRRDTRARLSQQGLVMDVT